MRETGDKIIRGERDRDIQTQSHNPFLHDRARRLNERRDTVLERTYVLAFVTENKLVFAGM